MNPISLKSTDVSLSETADGSNFKTYIAMTMIVAMATNVIIPVTIDDKLSPSLYLGALLVLVVIEMGVTGEVSSSQGDASPGRHHPRQLS